MRVIPIVFSCNRICPFIVTSSPREAGSRNGLTSSPFLLPASLRVLATMENLVVEADTLQVHFYYQLLFENWLQCTGIS
ncbi:hypothetical protein TNCV_3844981 [Trichonephila clavipes]|nr:hypothetical protein TNCV_3844981 [Trichonephila clavipes]